MDRRAIGYVTPSPAHLRVVDAQTGEVFENGCPHCSVKEDEIAGLEGTIRSLAAKLTQAKRDKDREARGHDCWPLGVKLFNEWKRLCNHPRSAFTPDRFWQVQPFLTHPDYGYDVCLRAVRGAGFDPNTRRRRNGSLKRYDDWGLIFRDTDHLEDFANRAPREQVA
jgi:hypothetical protein